MSCICFFVSSTFINLLPSSFRPAFRLLSISVYCCLPTSISLASSAVLAVVASISSIIALSVSSGTSSEFLPVSASLALTLMSNGEPIKPPRNPLFAPSIRACCQLSPPIRAFKPTPRPAPVTVPIAADLPACFTNSLAPTPATSLIVLLPTDCANSLPATSKPSLMPPFTVALTPAAPALPTNGSKSRVLNAPPRLRCISACFFSSSVNLSQSLLWVSSIRRLLISPSSPVAIAARVPAPSTPRLTPGIYCANL